MQWFQRIQRRLQGLFQKRKLDSDMSEEMRAHIEMRTRENIEAGMSADEAHYAAMRQFGWVDNIKETCREQRGVTWLEHFIQDLRYGARMLRKNPGLTAAVIVTLMLGIGATTAIYTVVYAVLLAPLPYPEPDQLMMVWSKVNGHNNGMSAGDFLDWKEQSTSFQQLAAWTGASINVSTQEQPEELPGMRCTPGWFALQGLPLNCTNAIR